MRSSPSLSFCSYFLAETSAFRGKVPRGSGDSSGHRQSKQFSESSFDCEIGKKGAFYETGNRIFLAENSLCVKAP